MGRHDEDSELHQPLQLSSPSDSMSNLGYEYPRTKRHNKINKLSLSMLILLGSLLALSNGIWLWVYSHLVNSLGSSFVQPYYNSTVVKYQTFHWNTDFAKEPKNESDLLWAGIFPEDDGLVSLPRTMAASLKLPYTKDPEGAKDSSHGLYMVSVLHNLHCVTVIRSALYNYKENRDQIKPWTHAMHCLDNIRQSLMCNMDATLLYTEDGIIFGDGQVHECRDWDAMIAWTAKWGVPISVAHP